MAFLTAIFGTLLGLYVNNFFTWKVKNKIDALDIIYKDVLELNDIFKNFVRENLNTDAGWVGVDVINDLCYKIQPYQQNISHYCLLVDGYYNGKIYQLVISWSNMMINIINGANRLTSIGLDSKYIKAYKSFFILPNQDQAEIVKEYDKLLNNALESIYKRRKELISFPYMLRRLFCNKWGGILLIITIVLVIITYYSDHIKPAVAPIIEIFMQ